MFKFKKKDLLKQLPVFPPQLLSYKKINYGCGYDKKLEYLNVDADPACNPDYLVSIDALDPTLPKEHYEELYAKDVLEHIPRSKSLRTLLEFSSLLKKNGALMVQTSSILHIAKKLEENPLFADQFGWTICLFGNQAHPGDFHYTGFTDTTLTVHLAAAGFEILDKSLVEEWVIKFLCRKIESWDDILKLKINNKDFINQAYERFFLRPLDKQGEQHFVGRLNKGEERRAVLLDIVSSPERLYVTARQLGL